MRNKIIFTAIIVMIIGFMYASSVSAYTYQYITQEQKETILQNSDNSKDTEKANQLANTNINALMEALVVLKCDYKNDYKNQEEFITYNNRIDLRYKNYHTVYKTRCEEDAINLGEKDPSLLANKIDSINTEFTNISQSISKARESGVSEEQLKKDIAVEGLLKEKLEIYKNIYEKNGYQEEYKETLNANILDFGKWKPKIYDDDNSLMKSKSGIIIGAINIIGIIVSVITLSIIGIRYMLGSVEARAEYKQIMLPWLIGAVMVFTMTTIPNIIYNIVIDW